MVGQGRITGSKMATSRFANYRRLAPKWHSTVQSGPLIEFPLLSNHSVYLPSLCIEISSPTYLGTPLLPSCHVADSSHSNNLVPEMQTSMLPPNTLSPKVKETFPAIDASLEIENSQMLLSPSIVIASNAVSSIDCLLIASKNKSSDEEKP